MTIDTSGFEQLLYLPTGTVLYRLFFWYFGWFPIVVTMFWGVLQVWLRTRRDAWNDRQKYIFLAIDIPRNNVQSPRAVENMFIYFAGAHSTINFWENWWKGKDQLHFSFEIVSIGGYIQFIIYGALKYKNLIETAVYSQYPDAEVYEIEDYAKTAPSTFPDDEYDVWGSEFVLVADQILPIRTYPEFEHKMGEPEVQWKDPMATLMDLMSSLQKGEQLWYQIIVVPIDQAWTAGRDKLVSKLLKEKLPATKANQGVDKILGWMGEASEHVYSIWGDIEEKKKENDPLKMMNLKPNQKDQIEAADLKISKLGFEVVIRGVYVARKEIFKKPKVVAGLVGYIKQFNTGNLNALKPDTKITMTNAKYFFTDYRKKFKKENIMRAYKRRSDMRGRKPWVLNVEELATLWHFPIDAVVKAPLIQRAGVRKVEPPMSVPFGSDVKKSAAMREPIFDENYYIDDEYMDADDIKAAEAAANTPAAKTPSTPGFMDDVEQVEATENIEVVKEVAPTIEDLGEAESYLVDDQTNIPLAANINQPSESAAHRGSPPPNLPFAD